MPDGRHEAPDPLMNPAATPPAPAAPAAGWAPHPKLAAGGIAGAVTTLILWVVTLAGITAPPEVAGAITTIIGVAVAYFVPSGD